MRSKWFNRGNRRNKAYLTMKLNDSFTGKLGTHTPAHPDATGNTLHRIHTAHTYTAPRLKVGGAREHIEETECSVFHYQRQVRRVCFVSVSLVAFRWTERP